MPKKLPVTTGDRFVKAGNPPSHWTVDRTLEYPDIPPHVRLVEQGGNHRTITVALSALLDQRSYRPMAAAPPH